MKDKELLDTIEDLIVNFLGDEDNPVSGADAIDMLVRITNLMDERDKP